MTNNTKLYYLAINRKTKQYFIGYSSLKPDYNFRYEFKNLNQGNYEDYRYYRFNNLDDVFYFLDTNINIVFNDEWAMLNKQVNYRQSLKDYLQSHYKKSIVDYDKTDRGYEFDVYQF